MLGSDGGGITDRRPLEPRTLDHSPGVSKYLELAGTALEQNQRDGRDRAAWSQQSSRVSPYNPEWIWLCGWYATAGIRSGFL